MIDPVKPHFLDFEASSLDRESWPLDVGVAWAEGDEIRVYGELICPDPGWPISAWSNESATVHGIPLSELGAAAPAIAVARRVADLLAGEVVASDAPEFDERWLRKLLQLLPDPPRIRIIDFDVLVHTAFPDRKSLTSVYETLERTRTPHRAPGDARRLAEAWAAGFGWRAS